jgi:hypothetical protein
MPRTSRPIDADPEAQRSFHPAASLAFWSCLAVSAAMFAAVALSPRLRTCRELHREYDTLSRQLVAEERQVDFLRKVVDALKTDPDFARELARADFGDSTGSERLPVNALLARNAGPPLPTAAPEIGREGTLAWIPSILWIDALADNRPIRRSLLGTSALLIVMSFTFFGTSSTRSPSAQQAGLSKDCRRWLRGRYSSRRATAPPRRTTV